MESVSTDTTQNPIIPVQGSGNVSEKTDSSNIQQTSEQSAVADEFSKLMKKALGESTTEVSEEEIFAALIQDRLQKENSDAATFYETQVSTLKTQMARGDGKVSMEDVGKEALKATVAAGKIDQTKAEMIHATAFAAAQLDDNKDALFDAWGGADDATVAVSSMEEAMTKMKLALEEIESGKVAISPLSLDTPSNSKMGGGSFGGAEFGASDFAELIPTGPAPTGAQALDGDGGFLWKPQAEKDGKLVVILPQAFTGNVTKLELHKQLPATEETKVEEGNYSGVGNGEREHFRFSQSGGSYGSNLYVVATNADGTQASWEISDGSQRLD